ncbi:MAG: Uma2 family endonuclease [Cyanobacteria bacterium J06621_8]
MAYIRTKKVKGKKYQYLVEGYRDQNGNVKQRTIRYLGAASSTEELATITFAEYLSYQDGTNRRYELVDGQLVTMPPASFLHSDIIDFIADCFKAIARQHKLDLKVKTGDVGVRTGSNSSRIPDISVIDGQLWQSYRRNQSAIIEDGIILAVEVVSPGVEQIARDYTDKVKEYQNAGIPEYWIVDPEEQKVTVLILKDGRYSKTVFTGKDEIVSITFSQLQLTASEIIEA